MSKQETKTTKEPKWSWSFPIFAKLERHRGDRHFENHRGGGFSGDAHHHHHNNHHNHHHSNHPDHHYYDQQDHHHSNHYDHNSNNHFVNNDPNNSFVGGGFRPGGGTPLSGRKRFHRSGRGASPDYNDRDSSVKLYVASIPRTVTEDDIRPLFEEHGNVVEIVLLKDKRTGHQHGACFVKYAKIEEADRAIKVLHNLQAFPGASDALIVRYASERNRPGTLGDKLYIGGLNKQASEKEIEEIFSSYGVVEDIYIVCNELKQNRGCGFLKFSHRDMAVAAINALNGTYIMRGCDKPLIVRFADPKKPRNEDSRVNSAYGGPNFGPRSHEPITRLGSNLDDPVGGHMLPNASSVSNSSSVGALPGSVSHPLQQSPSRLPQTSSQIIQNLQEHPQPLMQNLEQKQRSQVTSQQCPRTERYSQSVTTTCESAVVLPSNMTTSPSVPKTTLTAAPFDCDWSEHICPDGCKYYYNCVTCESRWEKPEEYTSFEQEVMIQLKSLSCQQVS